VIWDERKMRPSFTTRDGSLFTRPCFPKTLTGIVPGKIDRGKESLPITAGGIRRGKAEGERVAFIRTHPSQEGSAEFIRILRQKSYFTLMEAKREWLKPNRKSGGDGRSYLVSLKKTGRKRRMAKFDRPR